MTLGATQEREPPVTIFLDNHRDDAFAIDQASRCGAPP